MEKSCLVLSQATILIGVTLDSLAMTARSSSHRVVDILCLLAQFQEGGLNYVISLGSLGKTNIHCLLSHHPLKRWLKNFHLAALQYRCRKIKESLPWPCDGTAYTCSWELLYVMFILAEICLSQMSVTQNGVQGARVRQPRAGVCGRLGGTQCARAADRSPGLTAISERQTCPCTIRQHINSVLYKSQG